MKLLLTVIIDLNIAFVLTPTLTIVTIVVMKFYYVADERLLEKLLRDMKSKIIFLKLSHHMPPLLNNSIQTSLFHNLNKISQRPLKTRVVPTFIYLCVEN